MTASQTPTTAEELRGAGLRVTAARVALLDIVRDGDHLGVEAIAAGVRDRIGHISLQAVYDALHALTAAGLVRRIEPAGTPPRFEGRVRDTHHPLVMIAPAAPLAPGRGAGRLDAAHESRRGE